MEDYLIKKYEINILKIVYVLSGSILHDDKNIKKVYMGYEFNVKKYGKYKENIKRICIHTQKKEVKKVYICCTCETGLENIFIKKTCSYTINIFGNWAYIGRSVNEEIFGKNMGILYSYMLYYIIYLILLYK